MKHSSFMRTATLVMALCLIMSCAVFGSVAKYTSSAKGTDTATVAKWSFTVEDENIAKAETFSMDLFALQNENVEQTNGLIAPGTEGSIELNFTNGSQVNATYSLTLAADISNDKLPIQFKLDDGEWTSDITTLKVTDEAIDMNGDTAAHTLYWQWIFNGDDAVDTQLGIDAADGKAATCIVNATVVANQVN